MNILSLDISKKNLNFPFNFTKYRYFYIPNLLSKKVIPQQQSGTDVDEHPWEKFWKRYHTPSKL